MAVGGQMMTMIITEPLLWGGNNSLEWAVGTSGATGIVVKAGNTVHYGETGHGGVVNQEKPSVSHITFCVGQVGDDDGDDDDPGENKSLDLQIDISVDNTEPIAGTEYVYVIEVINNGPEDASNIEIKLDLPEGLTAVDSLETSGSYHLGDHIWLIDQLKSDNNATLFITVLSSVELSNKDLEATASLLSLDEDDSDDSNNIDHIIVSFQGFIHIQDDTAETQEDTAIIIDPLSNDVGSETSPLIVDDVHSQPVHGTVVINNDNTVTYTPNENYNGIDSFGYTACNQDEEPICNEAEVVVTVVSVNDSPVAVDDIAGTLENTEIVIEVLSDDYDVDDDDLSIVSATQPENGSIVINDDNTITYTPNEDFSGTDSFTYIITDGQVDSDSAMVEIVLNQNPLAVDDIIYTTVNTPVKIYILNNDTDDHGVIEIDIVSESSVGANIIIYNNDTPEDYTDDYLIYNPPADFVGEDSFLYTIVDAYGGIDSALVAVNTESTKEEIPVGSGSSSGSSSSSSSSSSSGSGGASYSIVDLELLKEILKKESVKEGVDDKIKEEVAEEVITIDKSDRQFTEKNFEEVLIKGISHVDCDLFDYNLYIINPDGTRRYIGTNYVQFKDERPNIKEYFFEDKGSDFDYNDIVVLVDSRSCPSISFSLVSNNASWTHEVWAELIYNKQIHKDVLLWEDSKVAVLEEKSIFFREDKFQAASLDAGCFETCDDIEYKVSIINPDGSIRSQGTEYVKEAHLAVNNVMYCFEDRGFDFDYNDVIVEVERNGCILNVKNLKENNTTQEVSRSWEHQIRIDLYRGEDSVHLDMFDSSHNENFSIIDIDLSEYYSLCK